MGNSVLGMFAALVGKGLDRLCGLERDSPIGTPPQSVSLAWVGGFPAHYMGEFHCRLRASHSAVTFIYVPLGQEGGRAFAHEVTHLPSGHIQAPSRRQTLWVWRYLERLNPQAVLIAGNYPRANLVAAIWAKLRGRPLYYLADSNPLDQRNLQRNALNNLVLGLVLRGVSKFLCIGTRNVEFYMQFRGKEQLDRAILPFPLPHLNQPFEAVGRPQGSVFVFLVFGRLEAVKAVDRVISAYAMLDPQLQQRSRLLIAGDGSSRPALESQVNALGLREQVEFRGSVPSDQAPHVFGEAHALVLASHDEPWGLVVNEALSAGVPVIGPFWIGSFVDLVISEKTGLVTRDNSAPQLAAAMQKLIEDPASAARMGQAGRTHVREHGWTIDGSLRAFDRLLKLQEPLR